MKKYLYLLLCITILFPLLPMDTNAQRRIGGPNPNLPKHGGGGRLGLAQGIEGKTINFGFNLGGGITMMDALNRESASYGAKGSLFVHYLIPRTQTLGIGLELGSFYLFANQERFAKTLIATNRNGELSSDYKVKAIVSNWLLPVGQVSIMGNFHPVQRFNVQLKVNMGVVVPIIPAYNGEYGIKDILSNGEYEDVEYTFSYDSKMNVGLSCAVGMKMLYALNHYTEFGIGVDWSYLRFSYFKKWTNPAPNITKELTQMGVLDLHIGFAFSF